MSAGVRDDTCVWALVLAFGLQMGLYGVWSGTLASVLDSMKFDSKQADWLGFGNTVAGVCGGLVVGGISGRAMFRTHLKSLLLWCRYLLLHVNVILSCCLFVAQWSCSNGVPCHGVALATNQAWVWLPIWSDRHS